MLTKTSTKKETTKTKLAHVPPRNVAHRTLTLFYEQDLELAREASCKLGKLRIILRSCTLQLAAVDG